MIASDEENPPESNESGGEIKVPEEEIREKIKRAGIITNNIRGIIPEDSDLVTWMAVENRANKGYNLFQNNMLKNIEETKRIIGNNFLLSK